VKAISIGAGTGARELETALRQIVSEEGFNDVLIAAVNDAGIAIYSSSRIAREEFPEWSASARCAVSLARRLQDPLAELAKIDPKLIGVGQYQHDVDQKELHRGLLQTVQFCVNKVGVNVNAAGESLLRYVSGLNDKHARRIVACRASQGQFRSRAAMKSAAGIDDTTYMLCAAFLRIPDGDNPLDRTAVHPECYPIVEKMASALGVAINDLIGNKELISSLKLEEFVSESAGLPTLNDIREELLRPGRDPRKTFKLPKFRSDVKEMSDLKPGMILEGTVTNVTNFGAFVDIGVRQDGLVHLSQMSNRFIRDPREAVRVGDVVQVKVISVEPETKRIGLSMKALSSNAQRRRKKQQRRGSKPPMPARQGEGSQADAASAGNNNVSHQAAAEKAPQTEASQRSKRPQEGPSRHRRRNFRKPEGSEEAWHQKDSSPKEPEPTLQEKIAILQSKFRGIN
jgi:protein Tex